MCIPYPLLGNGLVKTLPRQFLEASFSMRSVSYQRNVGDYFFPEIFSLILSCHLSLGTQNIFTCTIIDRQRVGKQVPAKTDSS
jgi:hypothetical protein